MNERHILSIVILFCVSFPSYGQNWWNNHFVIGMMFDPPLMDTNTVMDNFQDAINAGFNLFTGDFQAHNYCDRQFLYSSVRQNMQNDSTFFFAPRGSTTSLGYFNGRFEFDEPGMLQEKIEQVRTKLNGYLNNPNKLCYVNLYPYYRFNDWDDFQAYLNIYCNLESIPLPVLSFDNYFPHGCFSSSDDCSGKLYYSNLAEMRNRAGNRPLWSWILTTEWMTDRDTTWQKAYLRLSAFAPVAYGAKGLMCYSYDCKEKLKVVRALDYRNTNGWGASMFFTLPDSYIDAHHVAFGNFTAKEQGDHPDIGVKTDEASGKWHLKYSTGPNVSNNNWDYTNHWYGTDSETIPFIVYGPTYDRIAAIAADGRFLVAMENTIWQNNAEYLPAFSTILYNKLSKDRVAAVSYVTNNSNSTHIDLCIAWDNHIRVYYDWTLSKGTNDIQYQDTTFTSNIKQVFTCCNNNGDMSIHAICEGSGNSGWKLCSLNRQTHQWSSRTLTGNNLQYADHFWMEEYADSTILCMQLNPNNGGYIYSGIISANSNTVSMTNLWLPHSSYNYRAQGVRNSSGGYDLYCSMAPETHKDAIIGRNHQETVRYRYMSDINHYIRQHLQDIVMNCTWKGCYHAAALPDANDYHITMVNSLTTPIIKSMSSPLMAGIFEGTDSILYLVLVNKTNATLGFASVTLRGNLYSVIEMKPRIDTGSTDYSSSFNPATMERTVTWQQMTGGECVVLKLRKARNYFNTHRNSFFDSDSSADINHRFNNGTWCIDYASNGFGNFDSSYTQYGNDSNTYPILADYNGDGITDLALFRYLTPSKLLIDHSPQFGSWNIQQDLNCNSLISYIGLFDNIDDKADVGYVNDSNNTLYIRYAINSFATVGSSIGQYGSSANTRSAVGDYDGDGLDDLAAYYFSPSNSKLLIDYNNQGIVQGWDQEFSLSYIPAQNRSSIKTVVSDYDGDGKADFAYYNPSDNTWNIDFSFNSFGTKDYTKTMGTVYAGYSTKPVATDYDGDGMADMSLYVYSGNTLYVYIRYARDGFSTQYVLQY